MNQGALYCALGSFELDEAIYQDSDKFFVDDWRQTESAHDIKPLISRGVITAQKPDGRNWPTWLLGRISPVGLRRSETIVVRTEEWPCKTSLLAHWNMARRAGCGHDHDHSPLMGFGSLALRSVSDGTSRPCGDRNPPRNPQAYVVSIGRPRTRTRCRAASSRISCPIAERALWMEAGMAVSIATARPDRKRQRGASLAA